MNRNVLRLRLKESGDAVWHSDGGRLFQDVGPVYAKAHCPAEESFALGTLYNEMDNLDGLAVNSPSSPQTRS